MTRKIIISVTNDIAYDQRMQKTAYTLEKNGYAVLIVGRLKQNSQPISSPNFTTHRFNLFFHKGKFFYLEYNIRLFFFLLRQSADIFCAVDLDTIMPNVLVGKIKKIPVVYDAHEYFTEVPEVQGRPWVKVIWKWVERWSIPQVAAMYTVSTGLADMFDMEYHQKCQLIFNFPLKQSSEITRTRENIILYQGDINEGRGLELAIEAMKYIESYKLCIVGQGYDLERLKNLCREWSLDEKVQFIPSQSPENLRALTLKAKIGLNLLENKGLNHYYSLANKFFDYIQVGVPPISMAFPEYQKINEQYACGILIDGLNLKAYLEAILPILHSSKTYDDLVENCYLAASFLNWETQEKELSSIYNNV